MSLFSETIGSFIRTGDYPLEADYIFKSRTDLEKYCEENLTILHDGLLKVVIGSNPLDNGLYWIKKVDEIDYRPFKLVDDNSISSLEELVSDLDIRLDDAFEAITELQEKINPLDWHEG